MLVGFHTRAQPAVSVGQSQKHVSADRKPEPSRFGRKLAAKEVLFRVGDGRSSFYRVEKGAICVYEARWQDGPNVIEFAFPGDFVGLGFLETQSCNASAVCECEVNCLPWAELMSTIAGNADAQNKLQIAVEREFELCRTEIVERGHRFPLERVASFLLALSRNNASEGRDPNIIGDSMECGLAADYLGLSVDDLGSLLVELKETGLICLTSTKAIRIIDNKALEDLASGRAEVGAVEHMHKNPAGWHTHGAHQFN